MIINDYVYLITNCDNKMTIYICICYDHISCKRSIQYQKLITSFKRYVSSALDRCLNLHV